MVVRVRLWRKLTTEKWMLLNCGESPLDCKEIPAVHPKGDQSWVFIGRTDAEAESPILWPHHAKSWLIGKEPDTGREGTGWEGDDRGWDGWMASPTRWAWAWVNSRSLWWTWRPGTLRFMWSQKSDTTEQLNWLRDSALKLPLSLLLTIGFLTSLEEFSYLAVLSHHDRWKYFKEYLQTKYSCIVHKLLISHLMYKKIYLFNEVLPSFPRWQYHLSPYCFLISFSPFLSHCHILSYSYLSEQHQFPCFNSVSLDL